MDTVTKIVEARLDQEDIKKIRSDKKWTIGCLSIASLPIFLAAFYFALHLSDGTEIVLFALPSFLFGGFIIYRLYRNWNVGASKQKKILTGIILDKSHGDFGNTFYFDYNYMVKVPFDIYETYSKGDKVAIEFTSGEKSFLKINLIKKAEAIFD